MTESQETMPVHCCVCDGEIFPFHDTRIYGNNPDPLPHAEGGRCCDFCNTAFVIPARMGIFTKRYEKESKEG